MIVQEVEHKQCLCTVKSVVGAATTVAHPGQVALWTARKDALVTLGGEELV